MSHIGQPPKSPSVMSTTSGGGDGTKTKKKQKKPVAPISLEEIFNQVSSVTSSNLNPPPSKIVLTPRSAECCLKLGINPEILKIRDIDSFWESGLDPAIQRIRHEAYVQRRYDVMKQCRLERKRMSAAEFEAATNLTTVETLTPEMILQQQREQNSTLIQLEMQRIEKMQKRQQKELEQMISVSAHCMCYGISFHSSLYTSINIYHHHLHPSLSIIPALSMLQFEVNRAKVNQEMEQRIQEAKRKENLRKKQQEKRMKLMAEERRLRELQKIALEEAEEQNRIALAGEMHRKEKELIEEQNRKAAEAKRQARELEEEKKRKHDEHKQQLEQYFAEEQMQLRQRLEAMQYAEKKKQDSIIKKQQEHAENLRRRREAIEKRIEQNMEMAKMIEEDRKSVV